ncbi:MAG: hypothetical protein MJZ89_05385 [Paludibacteraceae bacterium]|nr:hypothetical protein [Paludibacteraceae bacterium]
METKRILTIVFTICIAVAAHALVPIVEPDLGQHTGVAPLYFGPNAFPVPDMLDGTVSPDLSIELAGDYYQGRASDRTADPYLRIRIPLFTDRVNLTLWAPVQEWYAVSPQRLAECRVTAPGGNEAQYDANGWLRGSVGGDIYVSTDILVARERLFLPGMTIRAALKTASGDQFEYARYYDAPGYFFDASVGKSICFGGHHPGDGLKTYLSPSAQTIVTLRMAGSFGFVCWQTADGRQNDAYYIAQQLSLDFRHYVTISGMWKTYMGWEKYGDCPSVLQARIDGHLDLGPSGANAIARAGRLSPYLMYEYGVRDYPYHHFRLGLIYDLPILPHRR